MSHSGARRRGLATGHPSREVALAPAPPAIASPSTSGNALGSFGLLAVLFVGMRLLIVLLTRPGGFFGEWSDFNYFKEMAELAGQGYYPYVHYWVEYPPVAAWLFVGAYELSLLLPAWHHPMLWFQLPLALLLVAADFGSLWLIGRIGGRLWGAERGLLCAWVYAGLFLPLYGNIVWFDALTVFCLLLGLDLVLGRRSAFAGLACGLGVAVKLFPIILVPIAIRALRGIRGWFAFGLALLVAPVLSILPFLFGDRTMLIASLQGIMNRRSWETIWALLDGFYGTGGVPALADRLFYPDSALWTNPSRLPWTAITAVFALIYLAVWWRGGLPSPLALPGGLSLRALFNSVFGAKRAEMTPQAVVALAGFTVAIFLLYSKGFSQQYNLLLLPFVVLLAPTVRGALFAAALVVDTTFVEGYIWINVFPNDHNLLRVTVVVRTLLFAIFAAWSAGLVVPWIGHLWSRARDLVFWSLAALAVLLGLYGAWALAGEYGRQSLATSPRVAVVEAARLSPPDAAIVYGSERLHVDLQPFLDSRPGLVVADPKLPERKGPISLHARLVEFTDGRSEAVFAVESGRRDEPVPAMARRWLARNGALVDSRVAADVLVERYTLRSAQPATDTPVAVFDGALGLNAIVLPSDAVKAGDEARVTLLWQSIASIDRDYTVFAHLIAKSADGEAIVAQYDSQPIANTYPTSAWVPGEHVADEIVLKLPADLPSGEYQVALGVYYVPTLQRLPSSGVGEAGLVVENDRVVAGPIRVGGR